MPNALPISRMVGGYPRSRREPAMKARISSSRLGAASGSRWAGGTGRRCRPAPFLGGSGFILMPRKILHICAGVKGRGDLLRKPLNDMAFPPILPTMKNQYFGDISDYRKYGLLRALLSQGVPSLLVAWMLTPDDASRDGARRSYLDDQRWETLDRPLFQALARFAK